MATVSDSAAGPRRRVLLAHLRSNLEDQSKVLQPLLPAPRAHPSHCLGRSRQALPRASLPPGWARVFIHRGVQLQRSISLRVGIYS